MAYLLYSLLFCERSSSGRAPPCQGGGSEFEPRRSLQKKERQPFGCLSFFLKKGLFARTRYLHLKRALRVFSIRGRPGSLQRAAGLLWGGRKRVRASLPLLCPANTRGGRRLSPNSVPPPRKRAERVFLIRGRPGSPQRAAGTLWGGRKRVRASSPFLCPASSGGGRRLSPNSLPPPPKTRSARFFQSEVVRGPCKGPKALCGVGGSECGPRRPFCVPPAPGEDAAFPRTRCLHRKRALRVFFNPRAPGVPAKGRKPFAGWVEASPGLVAPSLSR